MIFATFTMSLVGVIFIIAGFLLIKKPPEKINSLYGYRSKRSMSNERLWKIAQQFSGKLMMQEGVVFIIAGLPLLFFPVSENTEFIFTMLFVGVLIAGVFLLVYKTEKYLKSEMEPNI